MRGPAKRTMRSLTISRPNPTIWMAAASLFAVLATLFFVSIRLRADTSTGTRLATLRGISYEQESRSVAIVLQLSDDRPFTLGSLDRGFYVDIENTRLSSELMANRIPLPKDGPVRLKIRQLRKNIARVVFDFDSLATLQVVPLTNPARILVEMDMSEQSNDSVDTLSASAASPSTK